MSHFLPIHNHVTLVLAVASPFLMILAPLAIALFVFSRSWIGAALAATLSIVAVALQLPLFIGTAANSHTVAVRVMTANLYLGSTDAVSLVKSAEAGADVLAVQELTQQEVDRLQAAGITKSFPYHALDARHQAGGVGIWSRFPIAQAQHITGYQLAMVSARIRVERVDVDPTILVAHLSGPWPQPIDDWVQDLQRLPDTLADVSSRAENGCVIVAGDFNSTLDMKPFRQLLTNGYRDAAEQAGAGYLPTYPANLHLPPFMPIDHVLTTRCTASSVDTVALPGSDHRGIVATIDIPAPSP